MAHKRVLLRERDFHNARVQILQELTGLAAGAGQTSQPASATGDHSLVVATDEGADPLQFLALALAS